MQLLVSTGHWDGFYIDDGAGALKISLGYLRLYFLKDETEISIMLIILLGYIELSALIQKHPELKDLDNEEVLEWFEEIAKLRMSKIEERRQHADYSHN
jgi:hypothetical protein